MSFLREGPINSPVFKLKNLAQTEIRWRALTLGEGEEKPAPVGLPGLPKK